MPRFKKGSPEAKKWAEDMRKKQAEKLAKTLTPPAQDPPKADPSKSDLGLGPGPGPGPDPAPGPQDPPKDKVSCSECSAENDADAKKCVNCGEDFDE